MGNIWNKFRNSSDGNVAVVFAVMSTTLMFSISVAFDYNNLVTDKVKAQNALDTAVLASAEHYQQNEDKNTAVEHGTLIFNANCFATDCANNKSPNFIVTGSGKVKANIRLKSDSILGSSVERVALSYYVESEAQLATPAVHHNIYFVLDSSASLGIAATQAEIDTLKALTAPYVEPWMTGAVGGCAFACHYDESFIQPEINGTVVTTYDFARANGITLREDVLLNQVGSIIDDIYANTDTEVQVGVYAFSDTLELIAPPSRTIGSVGNGIEDSGLSRWGTRTDQIIPQLNSTLGSSGSGATRADPIKSVILVTDGLENNYSGGIITDAFDAADCNGLKANGINIAVLHLKYPDLTGQSWFDYFVGPHYDEISTNLSTCATNGMYFNADSGSEISEALGGIANELGVTEEKQLALSK